MSDTPAAAPIVTEKVGSAIVFRPQVKMMDDAVSKALTRTLREAAGDGEGVALVIDLSQVSILPSLALGRLVEIHNACKDRRQNLKLAGLQPQIRKVFAVTKLDTIFQIADSVGDAVSP